MALRLSNNAAGQLALGITPTDTTIVLLPGHGAAFPTIAAGDWFPMTLSRADGSREIVRVSARSGDTFTVTRGQEGTQAISFSISDRAELRLTAGAFEARFLELDFWAELPGVVFEYDGLIPPAGWLFCAGQVVNIADYPRLFAVLGTRYGGDGVATFGIPDRRGRVSAGADNMGGTAAGRLVANIAGGTLGAAGGSEQHTLSLAQIPGHNHSGTTSSYTDSHNHTGTTGIESGNHTHAGTTSTESAAHTHSGWTGNENTTHSHTTSTMAWNPNGGTTYIGQPGGSSGYGTMSTGGQSTNHQHYITTGTQSSNHTHTMTTGTQSANHTHTFTASTNSQTHSHTMTTDSKGGGEAHNNLQPTFITNKIIRT